MTTDFGDPIWVPAWIALYDVCAGQAGCFWVEKVSDFGEIRLWGEAFGGSKSAQKSPCSPLLVEFFAKIGDSVDRLNAGDLEPETAPQSHIRKTDGKARHKPAALRKFLIQLSP